MTPKQEALKQAIEARGTFLKANWWFGRIEARLYVECTIRDTYRTKGGGIRWRIKTKTIYLTFDDPAECYGCKVEGRCHPAHRIACYEALRIGNPETLPKFIAECNETEEWDGAPEKNTLAELIEKAASVTPEEMEARRLEYTRTHPPVNVPLLSEERLKELGF